MNRIGSRPRKMCCISRFIGRSLSGGRMTKRRGESLCLMTLVSPSASYIHTHRITLSHRTHMTEIISSDSLPFVSLKWFFVHFRITSLLQGARVSEKSESWNGKSFVSTAMALAEIFGWRNLEWISKSWHTELFTSHQLRIMKFWFACFFFSYVSENVGKIQRML